MPYVKPVLALKYILERWPEIKVPSHREFASVLIKDPFGD